MPLESTTSPIRTDRSLFNPHCLCNGTPFTDSAQDLTPHYFYLKVHNRVIQLTEQITELNAELVFILIEEGPVEKAQTQWEIQLNADKTTTSRKTQPSRPALRWKRIQPPTTTNLSLTVSGPTLVYTTQQA